MRKKETICYEIKVYKNANFMFNSIWKWKKHAKDAFKNIIDATRFCDMVTIIRHYMDENGEGYKGEMLYMATRKANGEWKIESWDK